MRLIHKAVLLACFSFLLSLPSLAQADTDMSAIYKGLDDIEQKLYSHTYSSELVNQRLERLEKMAYGDVRTGSLRARLDAVIIQLDTSHASSSATSSKESNPAAPTVPGQAAPSEVQRGSSERSSDATDSSASSSRTPLQAEVAHSETVKPVPDFLRGGLKFDDADDAKLEAVIPNNVWFKIPDWMAGKWHFHDVLITSETDLRTGQALPRRQRHLEFTILWGQQQDKTGAIWQFESTPNDNRGTTDTTVIHQVQRKNEPVICSASRLICRQFYTSTIISKSSHTVIETIQSEQLVTFTPLGSDQIKREASSKIFDQDGKPKSLKTDEQVGTRIAPYQRIDFGKGKDLRALFRNYLITHGLADLVPDK